MSHEVKPEFKQGKFTVQMFGEGVIALNRVLATGLHSELEAKLSKHPSDETEIRLAEIATHCGVVVNGVYGPTQIDELAAILAGRLEILREIPKSIIVS